MDEELKAMLEGAKAQGANDTDLGKIIDMYEADTSKKKAPSNWGSDSQQKDTATSLVSGDWTKSKTPSEKVVKEKLNTNIQKPVVYSKMKTFEGFSSADLKKMNPDKTILPTVDIHLKNKIEEKGLRDELRKTKVTTENMNAVSLKTDRLSKITKINKEADDLSESKPKDYSFLNYSKDTMDSGLFTFAKSAFDTPELAYDFVTQNILNSRLEAEGSPYLLKTGDELADDLGLRNIPAQDLQNQITIANDKIKTYSDKNGGDALSAIQNGDYVGASKLIVGTTIQSAPLMVAVILSGGSAGGLSVMGVSAAATQNSDLKMQHPEMDVKTRLNNAGASGVIEATIGALFTGASGAVVKKIIADKGVEVGSKIIAKTFRGTLEKIVTKNPVVAGVGEVAEEMIVEGAHQTKDIITGIRTEYDVHAIGNAGVSSTGMGAVNTIAVYGAKGYVKAKTYAKVKATNKEVFKLRNEIDGGNLSPENKAILGIRADRLEAENKKLLGTEIEKAKALPTEQKAELNALNNEFEDLKTKFDDIDDADDIPENLKPAMKEEIKLQASKNQKRKTEILSQNDGLEVNDDFSKFEGVEPDFDLENGKISSLPLKEQERINDLAVEKITGGDKTVEYTKEQASQVANEIYANEQNPQSEAEKVAEVSPEVADVEKRRLEAFKNNPSLTEEGHVSLDKIQAKYDAELEALNQATPPLEDVVAPSVEKNDIKRKKALDSEKTFEGKRGQADVVNIDGQKININEEIDIADVNISQDDSFPDLRTGKYKVKMISVNADGKTGTLTLSDGNEVITTTFNDFINAKYNNAKTPPTDNPTNGNVRIEPTNVGESGITIEATPPLEDVVATSVDGKPAIINTDKGNSLKLNTERVESTNNKDVFDYEILDDKNNNIGNIELIDLTSYDYYKEQGIDGFIVTNVKTKNRGEGIGRDAYKSLILNSEKRIFSDTARTEDANKMWESLVKDGFAEYNEKLDRYVSIKPKNEATPSKDITPNASIRPTATNVGESGITEQESPAKEGVSQPVDGGEGKGDASVGKKSTTFDSKKETIKTNPIIKTLHRGGDKGNAGVSKWWSGSKKQAGIFAKEGGGNTEVESSKIDISKAKETDLINTSTYPLSRFSKELGLSEEEILSSIREYSQGRVKVGIEKAHIILEEENIQKLLQEKGFEMIGAKENHGVVTNAKSYLIFPKNTVEAKPAETPQPKSKANVEVSDLDHTKSQIDKGVLFWDGNIANERVDLGISWADIRKGEADIKRGKENTVPAKRLIEAIAKAKKEGGYHYKQGTGGVNARAKIFVSLDDVQRSTSEYKLSDAEQKEVDANEVKLAQDYENYFEGLDLEDNIDIYENYENQKGNDGLGEKPATSGESKNDVSNQEIPKKPTTKEKIAERIKLSDAKVDSIRDAINGIDSIFGIKIKLDDVEGLNKNGIDIVNVIASIAKQAIAAGIHIDEAISKTIEHLKKTIDFDVNIDDIKERINPKKEESKSNDSRREKSSSEKASDLGLTEKEYLDLGEKIKDVPETGVFKKYLSGETIQREYGDPTNDQSYDAITLKDIAQHGEDMLEQAKELFGEDYVAKTLDYLQTANLNSFEKGIIYAALENLMDTKVKSDAKNKAVLQQQALVYADSQANLRTASKGINTGRLRSVYNAIKNGIDIDKLAAMVYTDKQKEAKTIIEGAVPNGENLNRASDINENSIVDSDLEKLISDGVDKQINEIYKKLPSNRRAKADKAITALENIQKRLRTKTYDASIGLPIAIIDAGITVIKNSIKAGVNISDAIEIGINHIKEKYGKKWDKEDDFRKDMHDGFGTEGIDSKERSPKEKTKANGVKETVKKALIDAGFYREVKTKNGVNKVLDWVKLVGRDGTVEGLKKNVEAELKKQGFDDAKIAEISDELELEYKRLAKDILDKATADLERRNLIKPSPNRKSDNQRLVDLYNEGLFGDNIKKYENAVNRVLGFSDMDEASYKEVQQKLFALAELYKSENKGKKISEQSINAVSNDLNHAISNLMAIAAFKKAPTKFKIASLAFEYAVLAQKALLGGIKTLAENVISGDYAVMGNKSTTGKYMTPALKKQSKADTKAVKNDIVENAGLYYGDTTTSLVTHSIIEDIVNQKIKSKTGHVIMSAITLRRWLDAKDSAVKVRLTLPLFVKNAVTILTSKTNPNGAMTEEDAIQFVSEALTGDNFDKALITAKNIIDDVNSKQEVKQLKDNPEAVHRFAMELVRENLTNGDKMTMSQVEDSFKAAYMSAGRSIGHEANNPLSRQVNMGNAYLSGELNKSVSNQQWGKATALMVQSMVMRAVVQPFAGGGANWTVIGAEKGVPVIGYISTVSNYVYRTPLELNSVTGVKNTKESLFRENNFRESAVRNVIGTGFAVLAYVTMVGYKDDDDENYAKKFNDWMNKPENKWVRPYFNKLSPTAFSFMVAMEDEKLGMYLAQLFGVGGESFNDTLKVIKSIDSDKEGSTAGAVGKLAGKPFSSPFAWKAVKDARDIYRGLSGLEPVKYSYKTNGFVNGYLQGGMLEQLGLRPDLKNDFDSPEYKSKEKQDKIKDYNNLSQSEKDKVDANNRIPGLKGELTKFNNMKLALKNNTPYYEKGNIEPLELNLEDINEDIKDTEAEIKIAIKEAGGRYKPSKSE